MHHVVYFQVQLYSTIYISTSVQLYIGIHLETYIKYSILIVFVMCDM